MPEQVINVKNSDRMVFVLRRADKNVGIASIIIYFLGQLNYMQRRYPKAVPYIDMANYEQSICEKEGNAWEYFFEQIEGEKYYSDSNSNRILSNGGDGKFYYNLPLIYDYNVLLKKGWKRLFDNNIVIRKDLQKEFDDRLEKFFEKGKRILGVKARGTDYVKVRPKGHNIQPTFEQLTVKVDEILSLKEFDLIFLATEDERIRNNFKVKYGKKVIYNTQAELFDCKEDTFLLGSADDCISLYNTTKEYLFEMYALSKCDGLISGKNSGIIPILLWNGGKYDYTYIFDLGQY